MTWRLRLTGVIAAGLAVISGGGPTVSGPEPFRAAYGPVTACVGGYQVAVGADEGVLLADGAIRLWSDGRYAIQAAPDPQAPEEGPVRRTDIKVAGVGVVKRLTYPKRSYMRAGIPGEAVGVTEDAHLDYLLPVVGGGSAVRLTSTQFTGRGGDMAMLRRFSPRGAATTCAVGDLSAPTEVMQWSPVPTRGPAVLCMGALALTLREGETATHTWSPSEDGSVFWRLSGDGYRVGVFGWRRPGLSRKPTGKLAALGYRAVRLGEGHTTLYPPDDYPRDPDDDGRVYLNHVGLDDAAAASFMERLEFVKAGDRRCHGRGAQHGGW